MSAHPVEIPKDVEISPSSLWSKMPYVAGAIGFAGLGLTFSQWSSGRERMFFGYLFAFEFWLSIALGCLGFVIIQHVVRAGWSASIRRIAENAAMTLPLFFLLFLPIAFLGTHDLYSWTHQEHLDAILQRKAPYLNNTFFLIRMFVYFAVWTGLAFFFRSKSVAQDKSGDPALTRQMWWVGAPAIALFALSLTFAAFDWVMSLLPHWYSTIFGVYIFAGSMIACFAFLTLIGKSLQKGGHMKTALTTEHYHDLGKFMFGFTVFWAYIGFSQFFLIWYANIPEEVEFFLLRTHNGWEPVSYALPVVHFVIPFFGLLSRHVKRHRIGIIVGAVYLLVVHALDIYWLVLPNFGAHGEVHPHAFDNVWIDIAAFVGVGGLFLAAFAAIQKSAKIVAVGDPRIKEALVHENY
jgi:hypothetical protein